MRYILYIIYIYTYIYIYTQEHAYTYTCMNMDAKFPFFLTYKVELTIIMKWVINEILTIIVIRTE